LFYRGVIINNRIYIKIFEDIDTLNKYIESEKTSIVSENTPLLSELTVTQNISLILEYHNRFNIKKSKKITSNLLQKSGLEELRDKLPFEIGKKDRLLIQFLRAYVSSCEMITIIKPFSMIDKIEDIDYIIKLSNIFNKRIQIVDTTLHNYYKENKCLIIK